MLEGAIAAYVEALSERELDLLLRLLLRAEGFTDIELVHGVSEFGRDFIAKRGGEGDPRQWSVQSKAGDLGIGEWRQVRGQLEDIRTVPLPHPLYDAALAQTMLVVTTGRLVGDARAAADTYLEGLPAGWEGEIWTGERIQRLLARHLEAALSERARGSLLSLLGSIDQGVVDQRALERHSRSWVPAEGEEVAAADLLEAALVANRLHGAARLDLACVSALAVLRAELVAHSGEEPLADSSRRGLADASAMFVAYAELLWERCDEQELDPRPMVNAHGEAGFWATYPVRCVRVAEILGLFGLWRRDRGEDWGEIADWLERFLAGQPGAGHPLSDRWAVALIPAALLLASRADRVLADWLRDVATWIADRYEGESLGLAGVDAGPQEEIEYLLGDLDHVELAKRRSSLVAAVVLDLACVLELTDVFNDARNDFLAVEIAIDLRHPPEGREAWLRGGHGLRQELNPPYVEHADDLARDWRTAPHQRADPSELWVVRSGLGWEALAVWCLLCDRYSVLVLREIGSASAAA